MVGAQCLSYDKILISNSIFTEETEKVKMKNNVIEIYINLRHLMLNSPEGSTNEKIRYQKDFLLLVHSKCAQKSTGILGSTSL